MARAPFVAAVLLLALLPRHTLRPAYARGQPAPQHLRLSASPALVDVGDAVQFTLSGNAWPSSTGVVLSFVSAHHGFTGSMTWGGRCGCFRVAVELARRIHPIETAQAKAVIKYAGGTMTASTSFQIRGLARNGRDYAPGGKPELVTWVSDPRPNPREYEHFCAWVRTPDGLGVSGVSIRFVVEYHDHQQRWKAGTTPSTGIRCAARTIGAPAPGIPVHVDVYAGSLHAATSFIPSE